MVRQQMDTNCPFWILNSILTKLPRYPSAINAAYYWLLLICALALQAPFPISMANVSPGWYTSVNLCRKGRTFPPFGFVRWRDWTFKWWQNATVSVCWYWQIVTRASLKSLWFKASMECQTISPNCHKMQHYTMTFDKITYDGREHINSGCTFSSTQSFSFV